MELKELKEGSAVVLYREKDIVPGIVSYGTTDDYVRMHIPRCGIGVPVHLEDILDVKPLSEFTEGSAAFVSVEEKYGAEEAGFLRLAYWHCIEGMHDD